MLPLVDPISAKLLRAEKRWRDLVPIALLLAAVLVFFAPVLFTRRYVIPWDFRGFHLPLAMAVFDAMKGTGSVLWDTTTYCGRPLFADPTAQVFYLPTDFTIWLSTLAGSSRLAWLLEWELVLHVFAAGALTYLLLRRMAVSRVAALCGGLVFELGGFFASQTQHMGAVEGAAWIPLMWAAVWELHKAWSGRWFGALGIATAMVILAGFPAMMSTAIVSTLLLAVGLAMRRAGLALCGIVLGIGLAAILLIPAAQLTLLSVAKYRTDWFTGWGLPKAAFLSLVAPPGHATSSDLIYCGIGGLVLALIGAARKSALPFAILTGLAGIWMAGTTTVFGQAVWAVTPKLAKGSLYPLYASAAFCLGLAVLAGLGLDRIPRISVGLKYLIAALVAADLIAVGSGRPMNAFDARHEPGITREQIDGSAATLACLRELVNGRELARFDTYATSASWATTAPLTLLPIAGGYNALVLERLMQVRLAFVKGERWGAWYEVENPASPMLAALNVRYLLSGKPVSAPNLQWRAEIPGYTVYENRAALPRFWLVHQLQRADTAPEAFREIRRPDFRPAETAVVEGAGAAEVSGPAEGGEEVRVQRYGAREVVLDVTAKSAAFLATSEVQYPGWHAWIDDREVAIAMTNGAFRGVFVPAGRHRVRFGFTPGILYWGAGVTLLSLCVLLKLSESG